MAVQKGLFFIFKWIDFFIFDYASGKISAILEIFLSGETYIKIIGTIAGVLTSISMMPQLIKTFKEKKADDISLVMLLTLMGGIASWVYYGILRKDLPIIFTNSFSFLLNTVLVILRSKYKK